MLVDRSQNDFGLIGAAVACILAVYIDTRGKRESGVRSSVYTRHIWIETWVSEPRDTSGTRLGSSGLVMSTRPGMSAAQPNSAPDFKSRMVNQPNS